MAAVQGALLPLIPERRRFSEVIDVDSFDDDLHLSRRPRQRRRISEHRVMFPETITIVDSDDEREHLPATRRRRTQTRPFNLVSPSPPPLDLSAPPVPPLPPQFAGQQSPLMRRRPPPFPSSNPVPAVVRPAVLPLAFEAHSQPVTPPNPTLTPAAPSHHVPLMGFGGALISQHRQNPASDDSTRQRRRQESNPGSSGSANIAQRFTHFYRSAIRRISGDVLGFESQPRTDHDDLLAQFLAVNGQNLFFPSNVPDQPKPHRHSPQYVPSYTHPAKPASGYTFDFAPPSSVASTSNSKSGTKRARPVEATSLLVCAKCLDPLKLGSGRENERYRLWGLRCGHLVDGKCVEHLMKPPQAADAKGKGKAADIDHGRGNKKNARSWTNEESGATSNSIRSRLRSRRRRSSPRRHHHHHPIAGYPMAGDLPPPGTIIEPYAPRPGWKKGKRKAPGPTVEASHEWTCPVPGCAKVHLTVLVKGEWIPDKDKGAVGVYA